MQKSSFHIKFRILSHLFPPFSFYTQTNLHVTSLPFLFSLKFVLVKTFLSRNQMLDFPFKSLGTQTKRAAHVQQSVNFRDFLFQRFLILVLRPLIDSWSRYCSGLFTSTTHEILISEHRYIHI